MRRGVIFNLLAIALFSAILYAAFAMNASRLQVFARATDLLVAGKVEYVWDDVTEDATNSISTGIVQEDYNLTVYDTLPPICGQSICNLASLPLDYVYFVRNYSQPDMEVRFLAPGANETEISNETTAIVIHPFEMEYYYPQYAHNEMFLYIPDAVTVPPSPLNWINLELNFSDYNFSGSPSWGKYWSCTPPAAECVAVNVTLRDANGTRWSSSNYWFNTDKKSVLDIYFTGCTTNVNIGKQQAGDRKTIDVINSCGNAKTAMTMNFNTLNYWVDFLAKIRVRDVNYNASRAALTTDLGK